MPKYYKDICKIYSKIVSRLQELVKEFYRSYESCRLKHIM